MLKKIGLVALAILVLGGLYFLLGRRPDPLPEGSESARMLRPGEYAVETWSVALTDSTRGSQAYGSFAGSDVRTLETTVWYPEELVAGDPIPAPLLVYSHGFMSTRTGGAYLAEHLASHGYVVAAADHPLTTFDAPDGPLIGDVVNQPGDVRFLVDRFLEWNERPGHRLEGRVDDRRIGVFGLSLGGLTATLAAFHPRLGDPRIDAAVSIAGPSFMLGPEFFDRRDVPFMMVATTADAIVDYDENASPVLEKDGDALLVRLENGSHTGFAGVAGFMRFLGNPDDIGCSALTGDLDSRERWWTLLGSPDEGIVAEPRVSPPCGGERPDEVMNPLHQQRLTTLAVTSFFQAQFAEGSEARERHLRYLTRTLPGELPDVTVISAAR